jgi:hypothetical protein
MSYRLWIKSLPKKLGPWLRQPMSIAGIASVGVHGLMWVVLPILPLQSSEAEEPEIQREVSLVELTPTEQGRLPDFSASQVPIPQLPQTPQTTPPQGSDFFSLTPLPNPYSAIPTQPSTPQYRFPPIVLPQMPPAPQYRFPTSTRTTPRRPVVTNIPSETSSATPSPTPSVTATPPVEPGATALNPNVEGQPNTPTPSSAAPGTSETPPSPSEQMARLREEQQRLRELYTFNGEGTGRGYGDRRSVAWFTEELEGNPDDLDQVPLHVIEVAPPREACLIRLERLPDEAWFGVMLNADGEFVAQPSKLRSSGYGAFDQQALRAIVEYDFSRDSNNGKPNYEVNGNRVYYVQVKFGQNLENCPSPAASQSGEG